MIQKAYLHDYKSIKVIAIDLLQETGLMCCIIFTDDLVQIICQDCPADYPEGFYNMYVNLVLSIFQDYPTGLMLSCFTIPYTINMIINIAYTINMIINITYLMKHY